MSTELVPDAGGRIGGSVRLTRSTGRWHLRQLERIEKSGGYPTDDQVSAAVGVAVKLLGSGSERAKALGAALVLKAREAATRRGMGVLKLAEDTRQAEAGMKSSGGSVTNNIIVVAGDCWKGL